MSFTASALSFLLEDLGKTLILTGAQIPLGELRNDAVENLLGSLVLAGGYVIPGEFGCLLQKAVLISPEVCLFFNGKLLRGNRTTKSSSAEFEAFTSPNLDPLAKGVFTS
jgi:lysophospholipase